MQNNYDKEYSDFIKKFTEKAAEIQIDFLKMSSENKQRFAREIRVFLGAKLIDLPDEVILKILNGE